MLLILLFLICYRLHTLTCLVFIHIIQFPLEYSYGNASIESFFFWCQYVRGIFWGIQCEGSSNLCIIEVYSTVISCWRLTVYHTQTRNPCSCHHVDKYTYHTYVTGVAPATSLTPEWGFRGPITIRPIWNCSTLTVTTKQDLYLVAILKMLYFTEVMWKPANGSHVFNASEYWTVNVMCFCFYYLPQCICRGIKLNSVCVYI